MAHYPLTDDLISAMDIVIIAIPVDNIQSIALKVLDLIKPDALVFDTGSTKHIIARAIAKHPKRGNFLLAHPIARTEYSAPGAAFLGLFNGKMNMICDTDQTRPEILNKAFRIFKKLGLQTLEMNSKSLTFHIYLTSVRLCWAKRFWIWKKTKKIFLPWPVPVLLQLSDWPKVFLIRGPHFYRK